MIESRPVRVASALSIIVMVFLLSWGVRALNVDIPSALAGAMLICCLIASLSALLFWMRGGRNARYALPGAVLGGSMLLYLLGYAGPFKNSRFGPALMFVAPFAFADVMVWASWLSRHDREEDEYES